jgi:carboxyl-terminal processing protease
MNFIKKTILSVAFIFIAAGIFAQENNNFEISKNIEIYSNVLRQLNLNYAEDINPGELTQTAIDEMLNSLDPYTVYVPESRLEDFELMTKGEYGGIGSLIQKQGDYVVITEPYEGFPAQKSGLKAGDKIIAIDGESAKGKSSSDVSKKLKGVPGTKLSLTIQHYGDTATETIEVTREKIKIPNIPYHGVVDGDKGYIILSQFNPHAAMDVKKAFLELKNKYHIKSLIFDLRGNGGGLLKEAVDIVNLFVPKGQLVVKTKGKLKSNSTTNYTRNDPVDLNIPVTVLVNGNTASASEIVSGALQDLDRAVIIGQRTFGKGLVQNIVPLPYNSRIKITIAKYYIPSGRCIQAIDYFNKDKNGDPNNIPDSLINAFKTKGGRTVYDGKGIKPDIVTKEERYSQVTGDLYAKNYIFNFANEFVLHHDSIATPDKFEISDSLFQAFKNYVSSQGFDYNTQTEELLKEINKSAEREKYLTAIKPYLDSLQQKIVAEKKKDIDKYRSEIENMLKMEIISRYYYQTGKIIASLNDDPDIKEAEKVLNDKALYTNILSAKGTNNAKQ